MSADAQNRLPVFIRPGLHSYNIDRKLRAAARRRSGKVRWLSFLFFLTALGGLGYYGYSVANEYIYQSYENWVFDQQIAGRSSTVYDWLMQKTPLGAWTGYVAPAPVRSVPAKQEKTSEASPDAAPLLAEGALLGRVEIPRLHLSAMVRQGVDESTLSRAVGHVPSTQGPGAVGNFAIAAHRDTLFRALKDIKTGDTVSFQAPGAQFDYQVISTKIVTPSDVSVLRPQGGQKLLTMVTCYPFYYVGSAPKRFIVTARLTREIPSRSPDAVPKPDISAGE
jgi:sortase A